MGRLFDPADRLTPRQRQIVRLANAGKTDEEICAALGITLRALRWHTTQIRKVFPTFRLAPPVPPTRLTPREREIATLVAEGFSNHAISERLHLSLRTVNRCVSDLYEKTGTTNRVQLARTVLVVQNRVLIGATEAG